MTYFTKTEFDCKCGCGRGSMQLTLVETLNKARSILGKPIRITSGFRCPVHNSREGGSDTSSHTTGWAVDIHCTTSNYRMELISALLLAGFGRIGIAKTFVHVDLDPNKPFDVIWVY